MNLKSVKSPNAIFFDWDNTLVNNWNAIHIAYNKTLIHMGFKKQNKSKTLRESKYSLREAFPKTFKKDWIKAKRIFYKEFNKIHLKELKPLKYSENLLKKIKKKKIIMGVISNKDGKLLRKECRSLGWSKYFKIIIGANDAKKDKPSKYPFLLALKKISKKPNKNIWYIGDTDLDLKFTKNMKCFSIFLENKILNKSKLKVKPDLIIKNLSNLKNFI